MGAANNEAATIFKINVCVKKIAAGTDPTAAVTFFTAIFVILIFGALTIIQFALLPVVAFLGAVGAIYSALTRLSSRSSNASSQMRRETQSRLSLVVQALIPPLVGVIAATAIYLMFAAELIRGDFFPAFKCYEGKSCTAFTDFVLNYGPDGSKNFAKALVWAFLAGFSERLVPNFLQKIEPSSENHKKP